MNWLWKPVAWLVSRPAVTSWLIKRAQKTPYFHLPGYMDRWWLFNAYGSEGPDGVREKTKPYPWLPSVRIHHILRKDFARDPHDHPWDARTIILKGGYKETRLVYDPHGNPEWPEVYEVEFNRVPGDTATLKYGEYHNITTVTDGGVWTLFITYKYRGMWGFLVDGKKVPHKEYTDGGAA